MITMSAFRSVDNVQHNLSRLIWASVFITHILDLNPYQDIEINLTKKNKKSLMTNSHILPPEHSTFVFILIITLNIN